METSLINPKKEAKKNTIIKVGILQLIAKQKIVTCIGIKARTLESFPCKVK